MNVLVLKCYRYVLFPAVLWILIAFNADPDQAFYLHADPDIGSQTNMDPCGSGSMKNILYVGIGVGTYVR